MKRFFQGIAVGAILLLTSQFVGARLSSLSGGHTQVKTGVTAGEQFLFNQLLEASSEPLILGLYRERGAFNFSKLGGRWMVDLNPGYYIIHLAPDQKHYVFPDPGRFCAQRGIVEPYCKEHDGTIIMIPDMLYGRGFNDPLLHGDLTRYGNVPRPRYQ